MIQILQMIKKLSSRIYILVLVDYSRAAAILDGRKV